MGHLNARIASNFEHFRRLKKVSVGNFPGISRGSLYNLRTGGATWTADQIETAAAGLDVHVYDLIMGPGARGGGDFVVARDGPAALRAIAAHLEGGGVVPGDPVLDALHQAVSARDLRALLRAASKLGDRWDVEDGPE